MDDVVITFLASLLIYVMIFGLVILWVIDGKIKKEQVIHALFAVFLAWVISEIIKYLFPTLRPYMVNGRETDVLINPKNGAFPSSHTAEAFALSVTIFMHDRKVGILYLVSALLVGLGRIFANVHYPIDIVGGAFLGTIVAVFIERAHFSSLFNKSFGKSNKNYFKNLKNKNKKLFK